MVRRANWRYKRGSELLFRAAILPPSFYLQHLLNSRLPVLRAPGKHLEVRQGLGPSCTVGVSAQHRHPLFRVGKHRLGQSVTGGFTGEVRQPVIIRDAPLVSTGLPKGRHVGQDHDLPKPPQSLRQHLAEIDGGLIAQGVQFRQSHSGIFVEAAELLDQAPVIQHHVRAVVGA